MDESQSNNLPPIILCAGLPRSGSTWVYNAVLLLCKRAVRAAGLYSDNVPENFNQLIENLDVLVIKSHQPNHELLDLVRFAGGRFIVTVRDPRDCVASLIEAFDFSKSEAINFVTGSTQCIETVISKQLPLVVKYEDALDRTSIVRALAAKIGCEVDTKTVAAISDTLAADKIRSDIAKLEAEGTIDVEIPAQSWTEETHWHPRHIGDGRIGKYKELLSDLDALLIERRNKFLIRRFDYQLGVAPKFSTNAILDLAQEGSAFATEGISFPENWGAWTDGTTTRFDFRFVETIKTVRLSINFFLGPNFYGENATGKCLININDINILDVSRIGQSNSEIILVHNCNPDNLGLISLVFQFSDLVTPSDLNLNEDKRLIGVGIRSIFIDLP